MSSKGHSLAAIVEGMIRVIDDARRLGTRVPVDTSSFITMAFYLGELRDALTHLNTKQPRGVDFHAKNPDAFTGMQRLKGTLSKLEKLTQRAADSSRLLLILDTSKVMSDLQSAVQDVGHDLNLVPVLSLMASSLPSDAADKLADLRSRMRAARFDSEPEIMELSIGIEDAVAQRSKEKATEVLAGVLRHFGASTNLGSAEKGGSGSSSGAGTGTGTPPGKGNAEVEALRSEVQRDLRQAEKQERWTEVGKLMDLNTFLGLASLSQEPPIVHANSRLAIRLQEHSPELQVSDEFKCSLTGEVMRDPVMLVESKQTFDRSAIEAWFGRGKRTCPKTNVFLRSVDLVPNAELRSKIEASYERLNERTLGEAVRILRQPQWAPDEEQQPQGRQGSDSQGQGEGGVQASAVEQNHSQAGAAEGKEDPRGQQGQQSDGKQQQHTVAEAGVQAGEGRSRGGDAGASVGEGGGGGSTEAGRLKEDRTSLEEALEALLQLTELGPRFALLALQGGAVPVLVGLIASPPQGLSAGDSLRESALAVLRNIARSGETAVNAEVEAGVVDPVVKIISEDPADVAPAVQLLRELSKVTSARPEITEKMGIVETIKLLNKHQGDTDPVGSEVSKVLEMYWREDPYVAIQMASVGMFQPLIHLLGPGNDEETRLMMADGVMQWGVNKASRVTLVQGGVLPPLVDLLNNGSNKARAAAARSIEHLSHTDINRVALAKAGVIPALVKALSRGGAELRAASQATLANLAMDDQDLDSLDEDGTAVRLLTMLRTGQQTNRDYSVRTLECMARESKSIRAALMEDDGAVHAVFEVLREGPSHVFTSGSLRSTALLLLSHLCLEQNAHQIMVTTPEVVKALSALLGRPIPADEREAVAVVMATMVGNKKMRLLIRREEHVLGLMHKLLTSASPRTQEKMMWGMAYLAEHDEADPQVVLEAQQAIARLGVIPLAVHFLKKGPDVMRIPSTTLLGNLSLSTPSLSIIMSNDRKAARGLGVSVGQPWSKLAGSFSRSKSTSNSSNSSSAAAASAASSSMSSLSVSSSPGSASKDKVRSCKVHGGKCSLESTFCLVEGELVGVLLELARRGEDKVAEVSLSALGSLLADDDDQERAAEYLVKMETVEVAASLVGRTKALTKWAVYILERIFHFKRFRAERFSQPAITSLGRFMTTATGADRKMAAETLMRLNILPRSSLESDL